LRESRDDELDGVGALDKLNSHFLRGVSDALAINFENSVFRLQSTVSKSNSGLNQLIDVKTCDAVKFFGGEFESQELLASFVQRHSDDFFADGTFAGFLHRLSVHRYA